MHAARLAGLDDQAGLEARPFADEVVVDGPDGERRRDVHALRPDRAVGEDQDVDAVGERRVRLPADALECRLHPGGAVLDRPGDVERGRLEDRRVDLPQALELGVEQDRIVDHQLPRMLGRLVEQVPLRADARLHAHHDRLADRVHGRVRHLGEELLEVRVEEGLAIGQDGQRRVVAHRADRLLGVAGKWREDHLHVLLRVAEGELPVAQRLGRLLLRLSIGKVGGVHDLLLVPLRVGPAGGDLPLDLVVLDDPAAVEIDEKELARLEATLAQDVLRRHVEHARLRGEHDPPVLGLEPAPGPQAVAVEGRADHAPVREGDRRRPVPGLHQALVVGVEALQLVGQIVPALVGLRDHHHHRVRQRAPGQHEQLEHVVEVRRVGSAGTDDGQDLGEVVSEEIGGELRLARPHPVDVAAQRVDLAVVRDQPVGVRELPARERVRREAGVDERERRLDPLVPEIGEVSRELRCGQHPLVDERARGEAREREVRAGCKLRNAPDHVQLPLERVLVGRELRRSPDDELSDTRGVHVGAHPDVAVVDRDVPPGEDSLALGLDGLDQELLELEPAGVVLWEEADTDAVLTRWGQLVADERADEPIRHLEQDPGAVAGLAHPRPPRRGAPGSRARSARARPSRASARRSDARRR